MIKEFEETKEFLQRRCIETCGHNANENCICKIALCLNEIEKAEEELAKYKKLERQLGNNFSGRNNECSFEMLLEATQNGFWYQDMENKIIHLVPDDNHPIVYGWNDGYPILQYMEVTEDPVYTTQCIYDVFVTDYKKKFWLKEDRSE
jgi:hypothetical protein